MRKSKRSSSDVKPSAEQIAYLEERMRRLVLRNPSCGIQPTRYSDIFSYLAVQKITYSYDDELFEGLVFVDNKKTGKQEELLDAYMIVDQGNEIHLKLFQFKFKENYSGGISTKDLYAFVDRMNRVFLRGDLQDSQTLEAFREVREALDRARQANKRARTRIHCYYVVNGQNVSASDESKVEEIRQSFSHDRQTHGFTFETYGGVDIYNLCAHGRVPIQEERLELNYEFKEPSILHHNIGQNPSGMPEQALVGFVNVNQLIRLVDRYSNNELFEKNVRLFLGTARDVNRKIIDTVTSNRSAWFGFMNNGVSITAEELSVDMPPRNNKVGVRLAGMQIINGCQTVNALYHAKYDPELKDRFQGNSNVLVRIYQVDPANTEFLNALIVATNSQNSIRPEDLLSNDSIQRTLQDLYREYGIAYERKEGEALPDHGTIARFTKEQAAMAYLGVFNGETSRLRNSLSRREFFREGDAYYEAFDLQGAPDSPGPLPDDFEPGINARQRALEILAARCLEESCRENVARIKDKRQRGSLKKGAFYLARIAYLANKPQLDAAIAGASREEPRKQVSAEFTKAVQEIGAAAFSTAQRVFTDSLAAYLQAEGGNEDAALRNSAFRDIVEQRVRQGQAL